MNRFFGKELYIRLAQDDDAFVCTTKYGRFFATAKKFLLSQAASEAAEEQAALARKRRRTQSLSLLQTGLDPLDED